MQSHLAQGMKLALLFPLANWDFLKGVERGGSGLARRGSGELAKLDFPWHNPKGDKHLLA
jgi:hypothetical protein